MARTENKKTNSKREAAKLRANPPFALVESFRNLTTNLGFAVPKKADGTGRLICISSALTNEGKTTVSVNVAISCASAGAKTILLDCDMRKPSVRRFFDLDKSQKGLLDYLSGEADLSEVLVHNVSKNLDVIAGRKSAPNPLALLTNERFSSLLKDLAKEYDYVIIDTPPLNLVSDALTIAELTDGLVLVVRQMVSRHPLIQHVLSDVDFSGINFLGFVLNDYKSKDAGKGYYEKYKYDYKYGYSSYK